MTEDWTCENCKRQFVMFKKIEDILHWLLHIKGCVVRIVELHTIKCAKKIK